MMFYFMRNGILCITDDEMVEYPLAKKCNLRLRVLPALLLGKPDANVISDDGWILHLDFVEGDLRLEQRLF